MKINVLHKRGFSLLELFIVVIIAGIVSFIAVGSYSAMKQRRNLRSAAESVNSAFVTARSYAVSRNAWHRVVFQLRETGTGVASDRTNYWIDEIEPNSNTTPNPVFPEDAVRPKITTPQPLPVGIHLLDANINGTTYTATAEQYLVIRFLPDGSSDSAGVRLTEDSQAANRPQPVYTVRLYPATGKSKIMTDDGT
jgi:prepilin-type N-terminal cleavage/methylation domain-containing protein